MEVLNIPPKAEKIMQWTKLIFLFDVESNNLVDLMSRSAKF